MLMKVRDVTIKHNKGNVTSFKEDTHFCLLSDSEEIKQFLQKTVVWYL